MEATLEIPALLLPGAGTETVLPVGELCPAEDLDSELTRLGREAIQRGVVPFVHASEASQQLLQRVSERYLRAFLEIRSQMWPTLARHIEKHPLELFRLIRESVEAIGAERENWTLSLRLEGEADQHAWWSLQSAAQTYSLSVGLFAEKITACIVALSAGDVPPDFAAFQEHWPEFLSQLDRATGSFEFGVLTVRELQQEGHALGGSKFQIACELASRGADEQHALVRHALRSLLRGAYELGEQRGETDGDAMPAGLFLDWVRTVLAV